MMKTVGYKRPGLAALAGLALILAACGQQPAQQPGDGSVTTVGISIQSPVTGTANVKVSVNEGAVVTSVKVFVDNVQVGQITSSGLRPAAVRPQAVEYTLAFDSAQLGPDGQPRFKNGSRTVKVVVTDKNGNQKSAETTVIFSNQDYVRGILVSQTDNPNAPKTVGTTTWYGNGDVKVTLDIVNYTGATYQFAGTGPQTINVTGVSLQATGGQQTAGNLVTGELKDPSSSFSPFLKGTPVSGEPSLLLKKGDNGFEDSGTLSFTVGSSGPTFTVTFGLDNQGPNCSSALVQHRNFPLYNFANITSSKGNNHTFFRGDGATDSGVKGIVYKAQLKKGTITLDVDLGPQGGPGVRVTFPDNGTYSVTKLVCQDALGNAAESTTGLGSIDIQQGTISVSGISVREASTGAPVTQVNAGAAPANAIFVTASTVTSSVSSALRCALAYRNGDDLLVIQDTSFSDCTTTSNTYSSSFLTIASTAIQPLRGPAQPFALVAYDDYGNLVVVNLGLEVKAPNLSDQDYNPAPTITSATDLGTDIQVKGTKGDSGSVEGRVAARTWEQGGLSFYFVTSTYPFANILNPNNLPSGVTIIGGDPGYTGPLPILLQLWDNNFNAGYAKGSVNIQ